MNPENSNIQAINKNLWAVRFSLVPLIPQLSVTGYKDLPNQAFAFDDSGVVLLNSEHRAYPMITKELKKIMRMSNRKINRELLNISRCPNKRPEQLFRYACLHVELGRRKCIEAGVK